MFGSPLLKFRTLVTKMPNTIATVSSSHCPAQEQVPPHRCHQYHSALLNLRPQMQSQRTRNRSRFGVVRGGDALPVRQLMLELVLLLEPWSTDTSTSSTGKERGVVHRVPAPLLVVVAPSAGDCLARPRRGWSHGASSPERSALPKASTWVKMPPRQIHQGRAPPP